MHPKKTSFSASRLSKTKPHPPNLMKAHLELMISTMHSASLNTIPQRQAPRPCTQTHPASRVQNKNALLARKNELQPPIFFSSTCSRHRPPQRLYAPICAPSPVLYQFEAKEKKYPKTASGARLCTL